MKSLGLKVFFFFFFDEYAIVFFVTIVGKTSLEKKMVIEFLPQHLSAR